MCGLLFALWVGRHNNGPINERTGEVRGGNVNSRVVKLQPLSKELQDGAPAEGMGENQGAKTGLNNGAKVCSQQHESRALPDIY